MKIFSMILTVLFFLGCNSNKSKVDNIDQAGKIDKPSNIDDNSMTSEPVFTITHKANYNEEVIIYLSDEKVTPTKVAFGFSFYKLKPRECLKIKASQFDKLIVRVGVGFSLTSALMNEPACSPPDKKICTPGNYVILNTGSWSDEYTMSAVDHPNTNNTCIDIEQWMQQKEQKI